MSAGPVFETMEKSCFALESFSTNKQQLSSGGMVAKLASVVSNAPKPARMNMHM